MMIVPSMVLAFTKLIESPLFLARKGKYIEAIEVMNTIAKDNSKNELS